MRRAPRRIGVLLTILLLTLVGGLPVALAAPNPDDPEPEFRILDERVEESSGLATSQVHDDIVYTINDSDNAAQVFAISAETGETEAALEINEVDQRDWEAIAPGPDNRLWIGDIGDNRKQQTAVTVYRIREQEELVDGGVGWNRFRFRYADGPRDAETLLIHPETGRLYIVSKSLRGAAIYEAPEDLSDTGDNELTKVADAPPFITDGSFSPDGSQVVLRGYGKGYVYDPTTWKKTGELKLPSTITSESLTFTPDGSAVRVGQEGKKSPVYQVPMSQVSDSVGGSGKPPEKEEKPSPTPSKKAVPAPSDGDGGGTLFGVPWWATLGILVIALIAGGAAYWPGRREPAGEPDGPGGPGESGDGSERLIDRLSRRRPLVGGVRRRTRDESSR